jgi:hypothetical protein
VAWFHGFGAVDRVDYISWLDNYRYALGVIRNEYFRFTLVCQELFLNPE